MSQGINPKDLEEIVEMGIPHEHAVKALKLYKSKSQALDHLFPSPERRPQVRSSVDDLAQAIQNSLKEVDSDYVVYDVKNPETQLRTENSPVGLRNIGNTCYFNSLIQTYFMIPKFVHEIFSFRPSPQVQHETNPVKLASVKLIKEMQLLFALMILGNKKYIDPGNVLDCLVDGSGNKIVIGDQKDVGEFNINLISLVEEGLKQSAGEADQLENAQIFESNFVSQLFYAKQHEFVMANEANGEKLVFENTTIFGQLSLDVNEKELYRAWDKAYHNFIEEFATPSGHKTFATQEIWPEKLPGILLFQIQRVRYDPIKQHSFKINSPFLFPMSLFGDRFILKNKNIYLESREHILRIKAEILRLEKELDCIINYKQSKASLVDMLEAVSNFLDTQQYSIVGAKNCAENFLEVPEADIIIARDTADFFKRLLLEQANEKRKQIKGLEAELEKMFDVPELKQYEYTLNSILIHEGNAETGHYYAYILDIEENVWRKYSDTLIKKVNIEEVMKNAVGNGDTSAYCLIYIYNPFIESHGIFRGPLASRLENYASIIPTQVRMKVIEENHKVLNDIEDFKSRSVVEKIKRLYDDRFSVIVNWSSENPYVERQLINFPMFLRINRNEPLARWVLLNICCKEVTGKDLKQLKEDEALAQKIELMICKYSFGPRAVKLSEYEEVTLQENIMKFTSMYFHAKLNIFILECLAGEEIIPAFQSILHAIDRLTDISDEYQRVPIEARKVLALRLSSFVNGCVYDKDIKSAVIWAKHLTFLTTTIGTDDRPFVNCIKSRLFHIQNYMKKYLPSYYNFDTKTDFDNIMKNLEDMGINPTFDLSRVDERLGHILHEMVYVYTWMDHNNSIAWDYVRAQRNYAESFMYSWAWLAKRIGEKGGLSEQEIRDVERKNGIVEKVIW